MSATVASGAEESHCVLSADGVHREVIPSLGFVWTLALEVGVGSSPGLTGRLHGSRSLVTETARGRAALANPRASAVLFDRIRLVVATAVDEGRGDDPREVDHHTADLGQPTAQRRYVAPDHPTRPAFRAITEKSWSAEDHVESEKPETILSTVKPASSMRLRASATV